MSKIESILDNYEDWEIAIFHKFKLLTYTEATRDIIEKYIRDVRGFYSYDLEKLLEEHKSLVFLNDKERCPKCKSDKIQKFEVDWNIPLYSAGAEDELAFYHELHTGEKYRKTKVTCNVCDYIMEDPNNRTMKRKFLDYLFDSPLWSLFRR